MGPRKCGLNLFDETLAVSLAIYESDSRRSYAARGPWLGLNIAIDVQVIEAGRLGHGLPQTGGAARGKCQLKICSCHHSISSHERSLSG